MSRWSRLIPVLVAGTVLVLQGPAAADNAAPAGGAAPGMADAGTEMKIPIGTVVPDFTLKDSDGKEIDLGKYRDGGIVVVTFLSAKCPVSRSLHPTIAKFAGDFARDGVKFLGLRSNSTETTADVVTAVRAQGITFPILDDEGNKVADELDAVGTPHMFIIDKAGKLRFSGAVCDNWKELDKAEHHYFKDALDAVLSGKEVPDPVPDAFIGCSIKRAKVAG